MRIRATLATAAVALAILPVADAAATPQSNIQAELQAGGVPSPNVAVATPTAAITTDVSAFDADTSSPGASLNNDNELSPDPTVPLPVAAISFSPGTGTPLPGVIAPPGTSWAPTTADANSPLYELQAVLAAKHEIARGTSLAGISLRLASDSAPYEWLALPPYDRTGIPPATVPTQTVEQQLRTALPAWAVGATVTVVPWTGSERRATVTMSMPAPEFALNDVRDLVGSLMTQQAKLDPTGAGIGSVVAQIDDPASHLPLYAFAGDADWGMGFSWSNPMVKAWTRDAGIGPAGSAVDQATDTASNVQSDPGSTPGTLP